MPRRRLDDLHNLARGDRDHVDLVIVLVEEVEKMIDGQPSRFLVYKYRMPEGHWAEKDGWLLGLAGGLLIDRKKAAVLGADWQAYARLTSNIPFAAIARGDNRLALGELIAPTVAGLLGYALVFWGHGWIAGVRLF